MSRHFDEPNVDSATIDGILSAIHSDRHAKISDFPILERFIVEPEYCNLAVEHILKNDNVSEITAKLLHATCLLVSAEKRADILGRFIFFALNRDQLINFVSFAMTLTPFFSTLMTTTVQHVISSVAKFSANSFHSGTDNFENDLIQACFIFNLVTLLEWQKKKECQTAEDRQDREENEDKLIIKYLGTPCLTGILLECYGKFFDKNESTLRICIADLDDGFREQLMTWGLGYVEMVGRRRRLCDASAAVIDAFLNLMQLVQPHAQLRLQYPHRLLRQFCALIIGLLKLVNEDEFGTPYDRVDFVYRCYAITGIFFSYLVGANKNALISALFEEALENSASLFGTPEDVSRICPELVDFNRYVLAGMLSSFGGTITAGGAAAKSNDEYSCLRELRSTPFKTRSAAAVAHSGTLSARHRKTRESRIGETETLRKLVFVHIIENLCMPNEDVHDYDTYMHLGTVLIDRFCPDGLMAAFLWLEWKAERELIARYVEISKKLDDVPFVDDFLLMLADIGIAGIFFALPLVKARFAALLIQLETTPLKDSNITAAQSPKIAQILSLFIVADFMPKLLQVLFEILHQVTNHEAFVLLSHFWNLIQSIMPESAREAHLIKEKIATNDFLHSSAGKAFISMIVLVIQRNMKTLNKFLPVVECACSEYSKNANEINENDWS